MRFKYYAGLALLALAVGLSAGAWGQEAGKAAAPVSAAPSAGSATATAQAALPGGTASTVPRAARAGAPGAGDGEITLLMMIYWGGIVLWLTMAMGFVAFVMGVYYLVTVTPNREVPAQLVKRIMTQIRSGDLRGAYQTCEGRDELVAGVVRAGLRMSGHDRYVIQDAMESEGERGVMGLWQKIAYLNNIGVIAPLMGLLGTVWGMVMAFSRLAENNAQVRSIAVASEVSKAMICTVGGLVVAIPSLAVYYFLRGRVVRIIAAVEAQASEVVEVLARGRES